MTTFTIVDALSSYNIILGRSVMNELKVIASTYHQKIKFSVRNQVGEVRGDQPSSRKCYGETVRVNQKKARWEEKGNNRAREEGEKLEKGGVHFVTAEEQETVEIMPGKEIWELAGISPLVAEHRLTTIPRSPTYEAEKEALWSGKRQGKWRMCVDFRDLNKASPKDCYPLPRIDQLVDSTLGFEFLSFMESDQGYHQISLAKADKDKASFITSRGTFCYVFMPFRLKNTGATYQRLMNPNLHEVVRQGSRESSSRASNFVKALARGEIIFYLSTTEYAVSSVLIREEDSGQKPVYYVSHALRGAELRYSEVEKIALALVMTVQKLKPFFLSRPIVVLTNSPLGRIMTHPEISGRMIKWTVEQAEYDIEYKPRVAIKAQALSDFLFEMIQTSVEEVWRVFMDGAASLAGCGVEVVLIAPSGEKINFTLRIDSQVTNSEAEYEAVIADIQAARDWSIEQIPRDYETKDEKILRYLKLIVTLATSLVDRSIEQIPRDKNSEADALAKIAASLSDVSTQEVLHFTQLILSTDEDVPPTPEDSWMTPLMEFITHEKLPEDHTQSRKIRKKAPRFVR
ncbi:uncharacterized protein LOC142520186 [Primulina tabacum]|uniref:uncharacterized protein LOC142520186 n=1 Tax=Primulina tabacum TaxID=48773 RepID=UPI003F5987BD